MASGPLKEPGSAPVMKSQARLLMSKQPLCCQLPGGLLLTTHHIQQVHWKPIVLHQPFSEITQAPKDAC